MNENVEIVKKLSVEVQTLINELYEREPLNETFEQVGFLNGQELILEFLNNSELGIAIEHLLYMVHESDIVLSTAKLNSLHSLANELGISNSYVQ